MERINRAVSLILCFVMVFGLLPMPAFAATADESLTAALTEARAFIDGITVDNESNDPFDVVSKWGTHFTWDNEKRDNASTTILYEWSYYNGVVFEGLEYLYEITQEEQYKDYVIEYLSSMIQEDGTWVAAPSSEAQINNVAGYKSTYGADCYKTASLLLDAYDMTGDDRYLTMAETLYEDLDAAAEKYLLDEAGDNYRHLWAGDKESDIDLWLDGLYMILPFRAEYAKYINDQEELDLIVDRLTWVSENMYDDDGLFYHAANNASDNSGTYWLRSIGWYAAAIADVMDSVSDSDRAVLAEQLEKLADGLWDRQGENGMWLNNLAAAEADGNPYETSGTALVCYAVLKAVNNGWLEEAYAEMSLKAFKGICEEKLDGDTLKDICFKGVPSGKNSTFYDNEGKGVGPFIMFTAEVQEYVNSLPAESEPSEPEEVVLSDIRVTYTRETLLGEELNLTVYAVYSDGSTVQLNDGDYTVKGYNPGQAGAQGIVVTYGDFSYGFNVVTSETGVAVVADGMNSLDVTDVTSDEAVVSAMKAVNTDGFVAYNITPNAYSTTKSDAVVSIPVPADWNVGTLVVYYIDAEGKIAEIIPAEYANGKAVFTTSHFSTYALSNEPAPAAETGWVAYEGANYYEKVTSMATGTPYVITRTSSTYYALNRSSTTAVSRQSVSIEENSDGTYNIETVTDSMTWYMDSDGHIYCTVNGTNYYLNVTASNYGGSLSVSTNASSKWTVTASSDDVIIRTTANNRTYYLRYNSSSYSSNFGVSTNSNTVSLYAKRAQEGGQARLNGTLDQTVSVGNGTTQDAILSKVTVEWDSNSDGVADSTIALSECDVTGTYNNAVAGDYTLTIAYNGKELGDVTVHVVSKSVVEGSGVLSGNTPVTTKLNVEPNFSNIKLTVTYTDGTTGVITVDNGLIIEEYDITNTGVYVAKISYAGVDYGTVRVTVEGNPYEGKDEATSYPEYPADGAVRIDKTAKELSFENTGVVEVQLDVAGVSVKGAVDVILVTDLSNSMAWAAGGRTDAGSHEATKMYHLAESVNSFADIFLAEEADGSATRNTMSLVTFGGYDADHTTTVYDDYADPTQTLIVGTKDASLVKTTINNIRVLADDALNRGTSSTGYYLSFDGGKTYGENYGNTNYDHAFMQTAAAIAALKTAYAAANDGASYDASGRQIYIIFMTDGAPSNYDGVYYNYKTGDRADVDCTWVNEKGEEVNYTMGNSNAQYQAGPWFQYIAGGTYNASTGTIPGNPLYWADQVYNTDGVADIINVGFDLDNGGFSSMTFTLADGRPLSKVLEKLVTGQTLDVYSADDADGIKKIYANLATELRYAGTSAEVSDVIDSDFTLQMGSVSGAGALHEATLSDYSITPHITVTEYELWTKNETDDINLIGDRKEGAQYAKVIEEVTFNSDGTEAYSTLKSGNIMDTDADGNVTITATYFTYTNIDGVESFKWNIGNITDKEIALSYTAYLKGSLEGTEPNGLKYTNEKAVLEYLDIEGKHATQTFPIPAVAWGGASTAYEFYLVNEAGEPCDREGNVIPFANRIIITGPYYEELYLNQEDEKKAKEIIAAYVLPAGYTLYDETAKYEVVTASGTIEGSLTISDPADGKVQTTILVSAVKPSYIQSRVAFGVMYNSIPTDSTFKITPDQVVIDYGKPIVINVNDNNSEIPSDVTATLIGFSRFYEDVDVNQQFSNTSSLPVYEGTYGTFTIDANDNVVYTPHKFVNSIGKIFCHYKITTPGNDTYYMVSELDVIPATIVYYETDFADGVFTYSDNWAAAKTQSGDADDVPYQNDGTIGQNTYGFDSTYSNDLYLSNCSSEYAEGQGFNNTTVTFSFTGTGFDLISRTGTEQGLIRVQVFTDANMKNAIRTVSVLNKSESNFELYQIPVVSINGLEHSTYYVKIGVNAAFTATNDALAALNRGNQFYFDAIRIYDPAKGNTIAEAAYNADGEANNTIDEVRNKLISAATFEAIDITSVDGMVYVDSTYSDSKPTGTPGSVNVADYAKIGPNNEVYLNKGQAVAFYMKSNSVPASVDIGAKSITGATAGLQVSIVKNGATTATWTRTATIESSTVQYYDLLAASGADASLFYQGVYVVITNTGDGVLSITDIKTAYSVNAAAQIASADALYTTAVAEAYDPFAVSFTVDAATFDVAKAVLTASAEPEVPQEPEVDTSMYDILRYSVRANGNSKNRKYTITVVTTQEVMDVVLTQGTREIQPFKISYKDRKKDGTREWTIVVSTGISGLLDSFTMVGVGADGTQGEAVEVSTSR